MGMMDLIKRERDRIKSAHEQAKEQKTLNRALEIQRLKEKNEILKHQEDIRQELNKEKATNRELRYAPIKETIGIIGSNLAQFKEKGKKRKLSGKPTPFIKASTRSKFGDSLAGSHNPWK
jgi:hypothetical protein